jgi:hypothetical protein
MNQLTFVKMNEGNPEETWCFDFTGTCGVKTFNAIIIVEPLSKCPGIKLNNVAGTHGIWGVENAIKRFKKERKKLGLTTKR